MTVKIQLIVRSVTSCSGFAGSLLNIVCNTILLAFAVDSLVPLIRRTNEIVTKHLNLFLDSLLVTNLFFLGGFI